MLYIVTKDRTHAGHVDGANKDKLHAIVETLYQADGKDIIAVQADCDELDYIKERFANLVYPVHRRVVCWYGDMAKFIVCNLF